MSIPDKAVVAAWEAFCDGKDDMQAALTAAAPFLMAQAWEEGHNHCFRVEHPSSKAPHNPYRSGT